VNAARRPTVQDRPLPAAHALRGDEDFGICQRTVYRDIQDLTSSGVPIHGAAGVGYLIDKKYHLPPVMFDPDELEAIALGINMVRTWTDEQFSDKAASALEKIQAVLPETLLNEMQQLATHSVTSRAKIPWEVNFSTIRECIRRRHKIAFGYTDERGRQSQRTVRPLSLTFFGPVWLLVSWCEMRKAFRNFRLDRMRDLQLTGDVFADENDKNLEAYLAQVWNSPPEPGRTGSMNRSA
jgi:predicted DNA-binding transcriptional regulator YafY